jgi:hypothetical protein
MKTYQKLLLVGLGIPVAFVGIMLFLMVLLFMMNETHTRNLYIHRKIKPAEIVGRWKLTDKSLYMLDSLHRNITGPTDRVYSYYTKEFVFEISGETPFIQNVCYIYANNQFESMILDTSSGKWSLSDNHSFNTEELSIRYLRWYPVMQDTTNTEKLILGSSPNPVMQDTTLGTFYDVSHLSDFYFVEKDDKLIMWTIIFYKNERERRYEYEKVN